VQDSGCLASTLSKDDEEEVLEEHLLSSAHWHWGKRLAWGRHRMLMQVLYLSLPAILAQKKHQTQALPPAHLALEEFQIAW
jgi:hypothetical protein